MHRVIRSFGLIFGFAVLFSLRALASPPAQNPKISNDLANADPAGNFPVIIQYTHDPGAHEESAINFLGGQVRFALHSIHGHAAILPASTIETLANDPNVVFISKDRPVGARQVTITAADYTTEPINAAVLWNQGFDGSGIGVAVIDSGITPVDDLSATWQSNYNYKSNANANYNFPNEVAPGSVGRIVYSQNFVPGESDALDYYGHGTHIAGLIAGNGTDSSGKHDFRTFYGAAPNANLINLRVLDENGEGTDSSVIAGIERAISLASTFNIRVIDLSLGRPIWESYQLDPLCQAVEQAWKAGIVVVVAAGNDGRDLALNPEGYGTIEAPGNDPYVITVGATRTMETPQINDDLIASYSSKGPSFIDRIAKPDIVARGILWSASSSTRTRSLNRIRPLSHFWSSTRAMGTVPKYPSTISRSAAPAWPRE
jgi:serine protease AprX